MLKRLLSIAVVVFVAGLSTVSPRAQMRPRPVADETGDVALQLLLRKLHTVGTFMMTIAHPDDENNALLAQMAYGNGLRTVAVTATRGDGGQNEIGPEIFDALAVLRSEELLAAHRFDGAEEYFTRAVDFGYSFSIDETYDKWGKDEIIGDYVRHIRTIRPDVVVGFIWEGTGGGQHHQASTHITAEAFRAAADPARYPEQIKAGLHPWQAKKFYYTGGGAGRGGGAGAATGAVVVQPNTSAYDPVLGRTYDEIGVEARSMHKCQGSSQLLALPGAGGGRGNAYTRQDVAMADPPAREQSMLDGVDVSWMSLLPFAGANPPADLRASLTAIVKDVSDAEAAFKSGGAGASVADLAAGLHQLRALRQSVAQSAVSADGKYEIDFRLAQKERQFQDALVVAASLRLDAIGNDPVVTPGQTVHVSLIAANRGSTPVPVTAMATSGFSTTPPCQVRVVAATATSTCALDVQIPANAQPTDITFSHDPTAGARYIFKPGVPFGVPFAPTPFRGEMAFTIGGEPVQVELPIEARYSDSVAGEKRSELLVAPALTLTVTPDVVVVPTGAAVTREVRVIVRNNSTGAESGAVRLTVPAGWTVTPASADVTVAREDEEATARFTVKPPASAKPGDATIAAEVTSGQATYAQSYQVVEYAHTHRRFLFHPAAAALKLVDVKVAPNLKVGYVMGVGDKVPDAIAQLGVPVSLIEADELAWGDLSKYSVIMLGVRAYERRADLRANNQRVIDYARHGGVVLLNYARTEFNQPPGVGYGPFPGTTTSERTTDENAPMTILVPDHPAFNTPNKIGAATWANWVQERGTYYFAPRDPRYVDLLESEDPFPYNAGPKRGILVDAKVGNGRWMYIGLVLWRELPAGVPGAYQILANLISLGARAGR
jgi:LmbE family N-acetylglucosaminyl deacetylase